jgi:hypothetical protein
VARYEELRKTMNMTDAITQLQVDILNDGYEKYKFQKLSEQNEKPEGQVQLEQLVRQLPSNKEIMDEACTRKYNYGNDISAFAAGAKWMREQARQSA